MKISTNFSRFVFGVILKEIRGAELLQFEDVQINGNTFKFRPAGIAFASMRELFKHLDLGYPRADNDMPVSYTQLTSVDMTRHIEWIVKTANQSGFEMPHIAAEWERILNQAGIYR